MTSLKDVEGGCKQSCLCIEREARILAGLMRFQTEEPDTEDEAKDTVLRLQQASVCAAVINRECNMVKHFINKYLSERKADDDDVAERG